MCARTKQCIQLVSFMLIALMTSKTAFADEEIVPEIPRPMFELRKHGTVDVMRDESGSVKSIKLIVTSYQITLDETSKVLEDMDGEKVRVLGTYERVNGEGWLTISNAERIKIEKQATESPEESAETPIETTDEHPEQDEEAQNESEE